MADLNDFGKSLSDMGDEELTKLLREIRLSRRVPTKKTRKPKKSKIKEPKNKEGPAGESIMSHLKKGE